MNEQYAKALERAKAKGLRVAGMGTLRATGEKLVAVTSASEVNRWHLVVIHKTHLSCDCPSGVHVPSRICGHRALAHQYLAERAEREKATAKANDGLRAATERLAAQNREWVAQQAERDAAPLARSNRGFSIWAS